MQCKLYLLTFSIILIDDIGVRDKRIDRIRSVDNRNKVICNSLRESTISHSYTIYSSLINKLIAFFQLINKLIVGRGGTKWSIIMITNVKNCRQFHNGEQNSTKLCFSVVCLAIDSKLFRYMTYKSHSEV